MNGLNKDFSTIYDFYFSESCVILAKTQNRYRSEKLRKLILEATVTTWLKQKDVCYKKPNIIS